jgi:molecular chaperone DnaK
MSQARRALIFVGQTGADIALINALEELRIPPMWPWEEADHASEVGLIIIDRPALNALKICSNLRSQAQFANPPMLILLDAADSPTLVQFSVFNADVLTKPLRYQAVVRYISSKMSSSATASLETRSLSPDPSQVLEATVSPFEKETELIGGSGRVASRRTNAGAKLSLDDVIPTSELLFPMEVAAQALSKGSVRCGRCNRWECRREDSFCAGCGEPLAVLTIANDVVTFEPLGAHRVGGLVEMRNSGQNPVRMVFKVEGQIANRFTTHTNEAILEVGKTGHLLVTLDARNMNLATAYDAVLEIICNEKGRSTREVKLSVERLAIARITARDSYTALLGTRNEWEFELSNIGGSTLGLAGVIMNNINLDFAGPVHVKGGQSLTVLVRTPDLNLSVGTHQGKMLWEFEQAEPANIDIAIQAIRPARLVAQPQALDFGVLSTKRTLRLPLTLVNAGGEELIVEKLVPSGEWIECLVETPVNIPQGNSRVFDVKITGSSELAGERAAEIAIQSNSYQAARQIVSCRAKFVEPVEYDEYIGIDFGTTASCVAVLDKNKRPVVMEIDPAEAEGSDPRLMPSVLYFYEDGSVTAGRVAREAATIVPENAVTAIKRVLGIKHRKKLSGREYDATELASKVIEQLVLRTEDSLFRLGEYKTPRKAVVTVPVEFFDNQRRALLEACRLAGLEMESNSPRGIVIDEAHAAALYYLSRGVTLADIDGPERLMIFDFGGGTLDCALIEIESFGGKLLFKTLASGGNPKLGGEDIDWALVRFIAGRAKIEYPDFDAECLTDWQKFQHKTQNAEIIRAASVTRARFKRQSELAKINLSAAEANELVIEPLARVDATALQPYVMNGAVPAVFKTTVNRDDLVKVLEPFLERAAQVVETVCDRAGVSPAYVNTILHTGRTSLLAMVRNRINAILANAEDRSDLIEPKLCVALGAAYWGHIKDRPNAHIEFVSGADRLPHDIGYLDVVIDKGVKETFVPVFAAQTLFPCETMILLPNGKEYIDLRLAENRGKKMITEGNQEVATIGRARIDSRGVRDEVIEVHFAINENRVLEITANGQTLTITDMAED